MTSQIYDRGPPSQGTRKWIPFRRCLPLFKAKKLASPHYATNSKHHKNNVHSSGLLETVRQAAFCTPSACELPEWSMWSLASSAQNCTDYIKTFVTSWYLKTPSPFPFRHKRLYPLPPPWSLTSDIDDPKACCIDFWSTVTFVFKFFVFGQ